jgi:hypothetical protein
MKIYLILGIALFAVSCATRTPAAFQIPGTQPKEDPSSLIEELKSKAQDAGLDIKPEQYGKAKSNISENVKLLISAVDSYSKMRQFKDKCNVQEGVLKILKQRIESRNVTNRVIENPNLTTQLNASENTLEYDLNRLKRLRPQQPGGAADDYRATILFAYLIEEAPTAEAQSVVVSFENCMAK